MLMLSVCWCPVVLYEPLVTTYRERSVRELNNCHPHTPSFIVYLSHLGRVSRTYISTSSAWCLSWPLFFITGIAVWHFCREWRHSSQRRWRQDFACCWTPCAQRQRAAKAFPAAAAAVPELRCDRHRRRCKAWCLPSRRTARRPALGRISWWRCVVCLFCFGGGVCASVDTDPKSPVRLFACGSHVTFELLWITHS